MLSPGIWPHTSRITSKPVGVDSRSDAKKVTVLPLKDPEALESIGTLNSMVTEALVDGYSITVPALDKRMLPKVAEHHALRKCRGT